MMSKNAFIKLQKKSIESEEVEKGKKNLSRNKKKLIAFGSTLLIIILLVIAVLILFYSTGSKYIRLLEKSNYSQASVLYNNIISKDDNYKNNVSKKLKNKINGYKNDFINEKTDYEKTVSMINKYKNCPLIDYYCTSSIEQIDKLYNSRLSYEMANESEQDIIKSFNLYHKVIAEDKNYNSAQEKIISIEPQYIQLIISQAKEKADLGDFSASIIKINDALVYVKNNELNELKTQYQQKIDEKHAQEEQRKKEQMRLYGGKIEDVNGLSVKFIKSQLTTKIVPDKLNSVYSYYEAENDDIFLDLQFSIKNNSSYSLNISDLFSQVNAIYKNTYTYSKFDSYYCESSDNISPVWTWASLEPLESTTYHLVVTIPREAGTSDGSLTIQFKIGDYEEFLQVK